MSLSDELKHLLRLGKTSAYGAAEVPPVPGDTTTAGPPPREPVFLGVN